MNKVILNNLHKIPSDVDLVVGIPRSGMLAALMISLHKNIPVTDVDGLIDSRVMIGGIATHESGKIDKSFLVEKKKILIIDDSHYRGVTVRQVKDRVQAANLPHEILYAVVYGDLRAGDDVDFVMESLNAPHVFEWNLNRNVILKSACLDLDGVICRNPTHIEDDDKENYIKFINSAEVLWRPQRKVGWIVTSRLEKYRELTEQWLKRHSIDYNVLIMLNLESSSLRTFESVCSYKSAAFISSGADLFIESSAAEAAEMAIRTNKNIFCFESAEFYSASKLESFKLRVRRPSGLMEPVFHYVGYLLRGYPNNHPIVGPIKAFGRYMFRKLK